MKILIFLIFIIVPPIYCQTLSGLIFDETQEQPLVGCNISILGTNRGAISNNEGAYILDLVPGKHQIVFQFIGYKTDTLSLTIKNKNITKTISLIAQPFISDQIVVFAGQYSEAEQLILRASREKKKNLNLVQNYYCKSYTKTSISGWADSLKDQYAMLIEAYSELTWNAPDAWHETVKSIKTSANIPHSLPWFNSNTFLDVNADRINLAKKEIVGPTAPDAIEFYHYEIVDTLFQDNHRIFKMEVKPKENLRPLMSGYIFLIDKLFLIQKVDVQLNQNANHEMYEDIHIIQQYRPFEDNIYLPYYSHRESAWKFGLPGFPKMKYRKSNFREDYQINKDKNTSLQGITKIEIEESVSFDSVKMNIPPLSQSEVKGYVFLDSLVNNVTKVKVVTSVIKIIDYFSDLRKLPLGNFSDFYRFNRVEGNFVGLAFDSKKIIKPFDLKLAYGYSFGDEKSKFSINPGFSFAIGNTGVGIGLTHFNSIESREDKKLLPVWYNTFQSFFKNSDYFDYYYSKGSEANLNLKNGKYSLGFSIFDRQHKNASRHLRYGLFSGDNFIQNPTITIGNDKGYKIQLNYSSIAFKETPFLDKREIRNRNYLDLDLSFERATKKYSDFNYQKVNASVSLGQNTFFSGFLDLSFLASLGSDGLPIQKWSELEGGFSGYHRFKTFRTLDQNTILGRNKLALYSEHNFHNSLFRASHIPYIEDIKYDLLFIYNGGWAGNKKFENLLSKNFYSEAGFGIGRIFNFLQIDFVWRVRNFSNSSGFEISIKPMEIEF
ncbi:MAG: carboxypeptidase-like regulatory domain-containing protein [Calditrichaeota bacterium]|nr:MAG: carboxypeptidase-like regulatory domain-containing protein [Calditrichota bacterium]MBL1206439.1 carboxypeptidase-like regulatory domain-containing protein [Calditrichota bacterium]NOG46266.1 carboxypeptidase-like regulatory domain-containing protein [Calditrichota bacterium]